MSGRKQAVVAIGHYKTGTTSLQAFLASNFATFAKAGILYPAVGSIGFASQLAYLTGARPGFNWNNQNLIAPHNALAFRLLVDVGHLSRVPPWFRSVPKTERILREIEAQTAQFGSRDIVLCSEVFSVFAEVAPRATKIVRRIAGDRDLRVMATLRRIDDHLMSWHSHRLRLGDRIAALRDGAAREYERRTQFDFARMVAHWRESFPEAELVVRDYASVAAGGGSCRDFIAQYGLDGPPIEELRMPPTLNVGFHRGMVEIARRGNRELPPDQARQLRLLLDRLRPKLDLPPSREVEMFGAEERQRLRTAFEPVAERVRQIAGNPGLFGDLAEMETVQPHSELDVTRTALDQIRTLPAEGLKVDAPVVEYLRALEV